MCKHETHEIAPRSGVAFRLGRGQRLSVIDPRGEQVADLVAFDADDHDEVISSGRTLDYASRIYLTNRGFLTEDGPIKEQTLAFCLSRRIDRGMHEDLDVTNHGQKPIRFNLEIAVRSDFADVFDVKSKRDIRRGHIGSDWSESRQTRSTQRLIACSCLFSRAGPAPFACRKS